MIAFLSWRAGNYDVHVMNADGSADERHAEQSKGKLVCLVAQADERVMTPYGRKNV